MPSTVTEVFAGAGLAPTGAVMWGQAVPERRPGVYVVALTEQVDQVAAPETECPLSASRVSELLRVRPELRVDGARPGDALLSRRLAGMWLADETVVYVGLAGTSLRTRVGAYYRTPLGARRPHAGGWPVKTLSVLDDLWVHFAASDDADTAELEMFDAFISRVSPAVRAALHDPDLPVPFASLQRDKGERKRHGITGAREPTSSRPSANHYLKPTSGNAENQT